MNPIEEVVKRIEYDLTNGDKDSPKEFEKDYLSDMVEESLLPSDKTKDELEYGTEKELLEDLQVSEEEKQLTPEQKEKLELELKKLRIKQASLIFKGSGIKQGKNRVGITRKVKKFSHKKEKIAKQSKKVNRIKVRHNWTTKEKKAR